MHSIQRTNMKRQQILGNRQNSKCNFLFVIVSVIPYFALLTSIECRRTLLWILDKYHMRDVTITETLKYQNSRTWMNMAVFSRLKRLPG